MVLHHHNRVPGADSPQLGEEQSGNVGSLTVAERGKGG